MRPTPAQEELTLSVHGFSLRDRLHFSLKARYLGLDSARPMVVELCVAKFVRQESTDARGGAGRGSVSAAAAKKSNLAHTCLGHLHTVVCLVQHDRNSLTGHWHASTPRAGSVLANNMIAFTASFFTLVHDAAALLVFAPLSSVCSAPFATSCAVATGGRRVVMSAASRDLHAQPRSIQRQCISVQALPTSNHGCHLLGPHLDVGDGARAHTGELRFALVVLGYLRYICAVGRDDVARLKPLARSSSSQGDHHVHGCHRATCVCLRVRVRVSMRMLVSIDQSMCCYRLLELN